MNYNITLYQQVEEYDIDELMCITQQWEAICRGWADPITVHIIDAEERSYVWEKNNDPKT